MKQYIFRLEDYDADTGRLVAFKSVHPNGEGVFCGYGWKLTDRLYLSVSVSPRAGWVTTSETPDREMRVVTVLE